LHVQRALRSARRCTDVVNLRQLARFRRRGVRRSRRSARPFARPRPVSRVNTSQATTRPRGHPMKISPESAYAGFRHFSHQTSLAVGRPEAFVLAFLTVIVWAVVGPAFHYSDTWQLTINTGTTIITFLMVF